MQEFTLFFRKIFRNFIRIQSGGFLGKLAGPLMKVAMPLAKNVLAPLGLSAAMSAIDGGIKKRCLVQEQQP